MKATSGEIAKVNNLKHVGEIIQPDKLSKQGNKAVMAQKNGTTKT